MHDQPRLSKLKSFFTSIHPAGERSKLNTLAKKEKFERQQFLVKTGIKSKP